MIVVIADDLSGAAELAGAARRHGLSAEVQTTFFPATDAEVGCVDTDTRLLSPAEAAQRVAAIAREVIAAQPAWIFKKCDSVLRGPVLAEARAVAAAAGQPRLLLIPANPSRQRLIRAGKYFVAGRPLNETAFAADPIHPRLTAEVKALLGENPADAVVPDINTEADVRHQAAKMDASTLPVGAVDFFSALLDVRITPKIIPTPSPAVKGKTLLICGSVNSWLQRSAEAKVRGIPAFTLPHDIAAAATALRQSDCVLLGIGPTAHDITPAALARRLAESVAGILHQAPVARLLLEGGATSAAVIAALGWTRLRTEQIADSGVGVLRPVAENAPLLFIKPGSYPWPDAIWP